ncbi:SDR family NAD(P)-dependent oxidoreductase [Vibrio maerlii]|uniref:SDR family NAD(P)-dependent oxidoreductase n=1 Tax=Vibrio maerlii TaxID=2231648 RepID=UPI000E3CF763|nr:SDR family NAD(P)-dependent oxidoreductase [Vibrio maerlii]
MQKIVIWGAASGLGAAMVEYFHAQCYEVIAVARNPSKNPKIEEYKLASFSCDATDKAQVEQVVSQLPEGAISISTMGSFRADVPVDYIGHRHLIDALEINGLNRFLLVTSLGCGDTWKYLSEAARKGFGAAVREKSLAEAWLTSSSLDYTILRPGGLKNGNVSHSGQLSQHEEVHGVIARSEVARLAESLIQSKESIGQIYACVDPKLNS